jgi:ubiquinone/menaquinone biosynthesis C-methylase UbiE
MNIKRWMYVYNWFKRETYSKQSVESIYDAVSKNNQYDTSVNFKQRSSGYKSVLDKIQLNGPDVLDLACGTGAVEEALKERKNLKIDGFDLSQGMLEVAEKRFKNYKNMSFKKGSFLDEKLTNKKYDLVTIGHSTRFVPESKERIFINNIKKWLKDDGYFVVFVHDDPFTKLYHFVMPLIGFKWKFNIHFQYKKTLKLKLSPEFVLEKEIPYLKKIFYKELGLVFVKNEQ